MGRWQALTRLQKLGATAAAAAGLALVGWFVNWSMPQVVDWIFPPTEVSASGRLLIIDTSASMAGQGRSKFDMAVDEIQDMVSDQPDVAFALRTAGGGCTSGYADPVVEFDERNGGDIRRALATARPNGAANIISQLRQGINDFSRFENVKSAQKQAIWLFLATARDCSNRDEPLGAAIKAELSEELLALSYVDFFVRRGDENSIKAMKASLEPLGERFRIKRAKNQLALHAAIAESEETQKVSP